MRCYRSVLLALVAGCGATGPDDSVAIPNGRYGYTMQYQDGATARSYSGDLIIEQSTETSLRYFFQVPGFPFIFAGSVSTYSPTNQWYIQSDFLSFTRTAGHKVARSGNGVSCQVTILNQVGVFTPGTCTLTFEGADTSRLSAAR